MGSDCVLNGLCYLGQRIRSKHSNIFPKWNYWKADTEQLDIWNAVHVQIPDLVPGKERQPGSCWISLFSVLRKMIILSRQTWKEGEYFALLILLGTNNLFGKWCNFYVVFVLYCETGTEVDVILRILQTRNKNKAILIIVKA